MRTALAASALTLATGLALLPATAAQADDFKRRAGNCSGTANYVMSLRDRGDDPDRSRTAFFIDGNRGANRQWTITIRRSGRVVARQVKFTNGRGNLAVAKTFRADDDAWVRVTARARYGETCDRIMRLDD